MLAHCVTLAGQCLTPLGLSFLICSGEKSCAHGSLVSWAHPKALCALRLGHSPCTQLVPAPPLLPGCHICR